MLTGLEAVNIMLSAIGESPVSTLDSLHPDVLSSLLLLKLARLAVLAPGRWFNTESNVELAVNSEGEVTLPSTCISVDAVDPSLTYVKRNTRLYNSTMHTFKFDTGVKVDLVLDFPFEDLPFAAQDLIVHNAAIALQANFVGDQNKLQNLAVRYENARRNFNAAELQASDFNACNSPTASRLLNGIRRTL